ncbi:MAG: merR [Phenylobacterium sp.]|uniref:MerR family transcriptional regulator n=1 Tax=Phenylobacterium sp. TaxID=1871053 RepID=UPI00260F428A|nr:MerR family transcriptional regulator [Phenylobacterium sp.]MDB5498974.1 merR [Phenylobacterium sp.]
MIQRRTIGRLAREAGVGVETIRFYERRGVLPRPVRPADGGYRHYDDEAVRILRYVRLAQSLGFTLKDVEQLLGHVGDRPGAFCSAVRETAEAKLAAVQAELAALAEQQVRLETFLTGCRARSATGTCPVLADFPSHSGGVRVAQA